MKDLIARVVLVYALVWPLIAIGLGVLVWRFCY
jgi:hypothetical protein